MAGGVRCDRYIRVSTNRLLLTMWCEAREAWVLVDVHTLGASVLHACGVYDVLTYKFRSVALTVREHAECLVMYHNEVPERFFPSARLKE